MTRARRELVSLDATPYYHCTSRCVRRAFLWGEDHLTGRNYAHRKHWVMERLRELDAVFAIEICAYAVMANHYHLVLRIDREGARGWDDAEVAHRWGRLFNVPPLVTAWLTGEDQTPAESEMARRLIATWRNRLMDISWFMRMLNEALARRANAEDGCTGRFWEGRFKSQALLDEAAVLAAMSYVDLNPIRAGLADSPETSAFTAIQQRIHEVQREHGTEGETPSAVPHTLNLPRLMSLAPRGIDTHPNNLGITTAEYLNLVDWTGRVLRDGKPGHIPATAPPILARLGMDMAGYLHLVSGHSGRHQPTVLGHVDAIRTAARSLGRRFLKGMAQSRMLYVT